VSLVHRGALRRAAKEEKAALFAVDTQKALEVLDVLLRRADHLQQAGRFSGRATRSGRTGTAPVRTVCRGRGGRRDLSAVSG
jgi:hypothetical protein